VKQRAPILGGGLCLLARRNVTIDSAIPGEDAVRVKDRYTAGFDDDWGAILAQDRTLELGKRPLRGNDWSEFAFNARRFLGRHEIEQRFAENLLGLIPEHGARRGAHIGIAAAPVRLPYVVGRCFDKGPVLFLAAPHCRLDRHLLRHVAEEPDASEIAVAVAGQWSAITIDNPTIRQFEPVGARFFPVLVEMDNTSKERGGVFR